MKIEFPLKICRQIYESWWSTINISSVQSSFPGVLGTGKFWPQRNRKGTLLYGILKGRLPLVGEGGIVRWQIGLGWECPPF